MKKIIVLNYIFVFIAYLLKKIVTYAVLNKKKNAVYDYFDHIFLISSP